MICDFNNLCLVSSLYLWFINLSIYSFIFVPFVLIYLYTIVLPILFINLSNIMSVPNYLCTRFVWGALVEDNGDHLNPGDTGNHISGG